MPELSWRDAIVNVLEQSPQAMHYAEIADVIVKESLRPSVGATPAATVNSVISTSIINEPNTPFVRVDTGRYWLRSRVQGATQLSEQTAAETERDVVGTGLINAFGMYWSRSQVVWNATPKILGQQQSASSSVDFCKQIGIYLLHDGRSVVYVGRTTDQPLGSRLRYHTQDRLSGRWDRFSWFGIHRVHENGTLLVAENPISLGASTLIATMEALLIEGLEPPQNRKRGDDFRAVEFLQAQDPDLKKNEVLAMLESIKSKL